MARLKTMAVLAAAALCACASTRSGARPSARRDADGARAARREVVQARLPENVRVVVDVDGTPVRSASGVVIANGASPEGAMTYVMTNAHVVMPRAKETPRFLVLVDLPTGDTQEFVAKPVATGTVPEVDLAVLSVVGIALEPVTLAADDDLVLGEDVFVVGAPYGRSLSVSGGMVSQVEYEKEHPRRPVMVKTDAAIGYGASGGGMFSVETGRLLGIIEGYRTAKVSFPVAQETYSFDVPMPGETFAAPAAKIRKFLADKKLDALLKAPGASGGRVAASR